MNIIRREFGLTEIKLASGEVEEMTFTGYGAVFNNIDAYGDKILPGAFALSLSESQKSGQWPAMLLQHGGWSLGAEDMTPIGIWVELAEDGHGLKVSGKLAETTRGREAYSLLKMSPRPAINGLSIGYIAKEWEPRSKPEDPRRSLKRIDLKEISLVTFPANPQSRVSAVKSLNEVQSLSDLETLLRDAGGFSRAEATALVARAKSLGRSDSGDDLVGVTAAIMRNTNLLMR